MPKSADEKKILVVKIALDPETNDWVATVPLARLVANGCGEARGEDAGQARNRLASLIEQHYPDVYQFEDDLVLPEPLQSQVEEFQRNERERERLEAWVRQKRVPLAREMIRNRVPQNITAASLLVTPTWLGQELRRAATEATGKTDKLRPPTGKMGQPKRG